MPDQNSTSAIMCNHANECPAECDCNENCYCRVHGTCSGQTWEDVIQTFAKPEFLKVYAPMLETTNGNSYPVDYFSSEFAATSYGKGKDGWGGDLRAKMFSAVRLADGCVYLVSEKPIDLDLKQSNYEEELRARTLAKLTPEERRVLKIEE